MFSFLIPIIAALASPTAAAVATGVGLAATVGSSLISAKHSSDAQDDSRRQSALAGNYNQGSLAQANRLRMGQSRAQGASSGVSSQGGSLRDFLLASGAENKFAMAKMKKVGAEELSNEMRDLKASEQMSYMSGIGQAAQGIGSFGSALSASTTQSNWKPYVGY